MNDRVEPTFKAPKFPRPHRTPPSMVDLPGVGTVPDPAQADALHPLPPAPQIEQAKAEPRNVPPSSDLLAKARKLADALVQSAEASFNVAQNHLERVKGYAQLIQDQVAEEEARARSLDARLNAFGSQLIEAHEKFHNNPEKAHDKPE